MATRQEWLTEELGKEQYAAAIARQDYRRLEAALIAPTFTSVPGEGKVSKLLSLLEIKALIDPADWGKITNKTATWLEVEAVALGVPDLADVAMTIDALVMESDGGPDVSLVRSVMIVLRYTGEMRAELGQGLISCLFAAGKLTEASHGKLMAATIVDAPDVWTEGPSIAVTATGSDEWLNQVEIMTALT